MKINVKKTKGFILRKGVQQELRTRIDDQWTAPLLSIVSSNGRKYIIALGKGAFNKNKKLFTGSLVESQRKILVKSLVWSVELFAAETWILREKEERLLGVFETWVCRKMERISCMDKVLDEVVLNRLQKGRLLEEDRQDGWDMDILRDKEEF